jgi:hypothetical protein
VEREEGLEAGDAAAGDDNLTWGGGHVTRVTPGRGPVNRATPTRACG